MQRRSVLHQFDIGTVRYCNARSLFVPLLVGKQNTYCKPEDTHSGLLLYVDIHIDHFCYPTILYSSTMRYLSMSQSGPLLRTVSSPCQSKEKFLIS